MEQKSIWFATPYLHECVSLLPKHPKSKALLRVKSFKLNLINKKYIKLDISNMATTIKNHNLYVMWLHFLNIISKSEGFQT